jgi:hypothetical protein
MNCLIGCAGQWRGTSTLFLPGAAPEISDSILNIAKLLDGKFARLDYT